MPTKLNPQARPRVRKVARRRCPGGLAALAFAALLAFPALAFAHESVVKRDEDTFLYFLDTPFTPRAWAESDFNMRFSMFDIPAAAAPNPEVGFGLMVPGASFKFFDRLELRLDTLMVVNPNDLGGDIAVDDPGAANEGATDQFGADFDLTGFRGGLTFAFVPSTDEKTPVRFAFGADYTLGFFNTPAKKHFDGGPFLSPYDHSIHAYLSAAFSFAKYVGLRMHLGTTFAFDLQRGDIFPGQDLPNTDVWVDYSFVLNYLFSFAGTGFFAGVEGKNLLAGVTSNMVEDQLSAVGGLVFVVGSSADVSIGVSIPILSDELRSYSDFALVVAWSMDFAELSFLAKEKPTKIENKLPSLERKGRMPDCPAAGPSKIDLVNETAYALVVEYGPPTTDAAKTADGKTPATPATTPKKDAPDVTGTASKLLIPPAKDAAATPAGATAPPTSAPASAPAAAAPVASGKVEIAPASTHSISFAVMPLDLEFKVSAKDAADVPTAVGTVKLTFCGQYELKFAKDALKTKAEIEKDAKKAKK